MNQEYRTIKTPLYIERSPVLIKSAVLLLDQYTEETLVKFTLQNIYRKPIVEVNLQVTSYDIHHQQIDEPMNITIEGHQATRDVIFGEEEYSLGYVDADTITVKIINVIFEDGSMWQPQTDDNCRLIFLEQEDVSERLNRSQAQKYAEMTGIRSGLLPKKLSDLWICHCGHINRKEENFCHSCGKNYKQMSEALASCLLEPKAPSKPVEEVKAPPKEDPKVVMPPKHEEKQPEKKKFDIKIILIALVALAVGAGGAILWAKSREGDNSSTPIQIEQSSTEQSSIEYSYDVTNDNFTMKLFDTDVSWEANTQVTEEGTYMYEYTGGYPVNIQYLYFEISSGDNAESMCSTMAGESYTVRENTYGNNVFYSYGPVSDGSYYNYTNDPKGYVVMFMWQPLSGELTDRDFSVMENCLSTIEFTSGTTNDDDNNTTTTTTVDENKKKTKKQKIYTNNLDAEFIIPTSSTVKFKKKDLKGIKKEVLRMAINEIYARHGYIFTKNKAAAKHFNSLGWYQRALSYSSTTDQSKIKFSKVEKHNIKEMTKYKKSKGWTW